MPRLAPRVAKLAVVLATYNEAANLPSLVERLHALPLPLNAQIYVVDDNSPDGTSEVARRLASQYEGISVVTRPGKLGLGSAIRDGMRAVLKDECTHVLTMDADHSHDPQDVPKLLAAAETDDADMVQGSRYVKSGGTADWGWRRRLQSRVANLLLHWLLGTPHESTTNFRVYNGRTARLVLDESRAMDFEFQPEATLIAMRHGLRIVEVPIIFRARTEGRSKLGAAQTIRWLLFFIRALVTFRLRMGRFSRVRPISPDSDTPGPR